MKRAVGIVLILLGIGILVASGYLFPHSVHRLTVDADLFPPAPAQTNWVPYVSALVVFIGMVVLLLSKAEDVEHR